MKLMYRCMLACMGLAIGTCMLLEACLRFGITVLVQVFASLNRCPGLLLAFDTNSCLHNSSF